MSLPLKMTEGESLRSIAGRLATYGWILEVVGKDGTKERRTVRIFYKEDHGILGTGNWVFWNWMRREGLVEGEYRDEKRDQDEMDHCEQQYHNYLATLELGGTAKRT